MTIAADTMHSPVEAAARLTTLLGAKITEETLEGWRGGARAQPLKSVKILGRIKYRESDLVEFARRKLTPSVPAALKDADRLLPGPILSRRLAPADADRAFGLLFEGRGVLAIGTPAPHAARVDGAIFRATEALNGLVHEAARHSVVALAMDRAAAATGGTSLVTAEVLTRELDALAAAFACQRAHVIAEEKLANMRIIELRERHRPLKDAVTAKIAALEQDRRDALGLLEQLKRQPRGEINRDMVANVPADRRAAVLAALGDSGVDHNAEVAELQERQQALGQQIETLKDFANAAPGDYTTLAAWPNLVALADDLKA